MEMIRRALTLSDWSYFVNLSRTCFPLSPQAEIHSRLQHDYRDGKEAHLYSFPNRKPPTLPEEDPNEPIERSRHNRLFLEGNAHLLKMLRNKTYEPTRNPENRVFLECTEPEVPNLLSVSRPSDEEIEFRRAYFKQHQHYCGRAWYTLHRAACENLVEFFDSPAFEDSGRVFLNCFEPDESFLQTTIMNGLVMDTDRVSNNNHRTFLGGARHLSDSTMHMLRDQKSAFFGRKLDHKNGTALRAFVEEKCAIPS